MNSQKKYPQHFSFEFFPPKTAEGMKSLLAIQAKLAKVHPHFFSVTFGAGGSTREGTLNTVLELNKKGIAAAPHISCVCETKENILRLLQTYKNNGITRLVALRGDLPSGVGMPDGELRYANELVSFIRQETGDHFHIEVGAYPEMHPQARSIKKDLEHFKRKVTAGANSAITQYFYNADAYFYFVEQCEKLQINIPIVPGIMPITNYERLARFSDACGAEIPQWIRKGLEAYEGDTASIAAFGTEVVTRLCEQLLKAGAPGLHFYTLNQAEPSLAIWHTLRLSP